MDADEILKEISFSSFNILLANTTLSNENAQSHSDTKVTSANYREYQHSREKSDKALFFILRALNKPRFGNMY